MWCLCQVPSDQDRSSAHSSLGLRVFAKSLSNHRPLTRCSGVRIALDLRNRLLSVPDAVPVTLYFARL
jgi:hypothetical protein